MINHVIMMDLTKTEKKIKKQANKREKALQSAPAAFTQKKIFANETVPQNSSKARRYKALRGFLLGDFIGTNVAIFGNLCQSVPFCANGARSKNFNPLKLFIFIF